MELGLFGATFNGSTIRNIKFENVTMTLGGSYTLGILSGWAEGTVLIENIAVTSGTITTSAGIMCGSIVGRTYSGVKIKNCYTSVDFVINNSMNCSGIGGYNSSPPAIYNCYWDGTYTSSYTKFFPIEPYSSSGTVQGCYYNSDKFNLSTSTKSTGLTTEQFANQNSFDGWDFENTWIMKDGKPELRVFVKE